MHSFDVFALSLLWERLPCVLPEAMATVLLQLLNDPALAKRVKEASRAKIEEFSARKMVNDIAALYEALLAEHRA